MAEVVVPSRTLELVRDLQDILDALLRHRKSVPLLAAELEAVQVPKARQSAV
jgi:predicted dienelactone hydrolase